MARISRKAERQLNALRERIQCAKRFREDEKLDDLWDRLIDLYAGRQFPADLAPQDRIAVNVAFATINVIAPSVSVNRPKITVGAQKPEDEDRAVITEQVINYWWRHFDIHPELRAAVNDFLVLGFGWIKTGYRFVEEEVDDEDGYNEELEAANADADDYAVANPHLANSLPTPDEIAASIPRTKMQIVEDRPFAERCSPKDVFVDPEATSVRDMAWIAHRTQRPLHEVRDDENYDSAARKDAKADAALKESVKPQNGRSADPLYERVTVWEMYDLHSGEMSVFAETGEGFLVKPQPMPYSFGHPFVMLRNYDVPDSFYPMGELEAIEPLQHELNAVRTAMHNDRKQQRRAWLYREHAFDAKGKTELASDVDNRIIPVVSNDPLDGVIIPLPAQQLNPQMYQYDDTVKGDINEITGLSDYARGSLPEIRRTATEASIIQDSANARAADKLAKVELVIGEVASRLVMLAQQYMTEPQVARVVGANGRPLWIEADPDDIAGEFDFEVEGGSTRPMNETQRRQSALDLLQVLGPMAVPGGPVNAMELVRHVLSQGFDIKDPSRFLAPNPQMGNDPRAAMGAPEQMPTEGEDGPETLPPGADVGGPPPSPVEGVPPEIANQLVQQFGAPIA